MHNDQGCEDSLQDRVALDDLRHLVPEVPAAPVCTGRPKPDAEGFQAAARLAVNVHADTDEPFAGREQKAQPVTLLTLDTDFPKPAGPGKLCEGFRIAPVGFIYPCRQRLVCSARINAHDGRTALSELTRQPDRQRSGFVLRFSQPARRDQRWFEVV